MLCFKKRISVAKIHRIQVLLDELEHAAVCRKWYRRGLHAQAMIMRVMQWFRVAYLEISTSDLILLSIHTSLWSHVYTKKNQVISISYIYNCGSMEILPKISDANCKFVTNFEFSEIYRRPKVLR